MWRTLIPAIALTCPVVRHGILTLAAICLHHESQHDQPDEHGLEYLQVAEAHGKIFVSDSRQKFQDFQQGLNAQDHDSILACSRLLCLLGFAFLRAHRQNGTTLADPAAWTWLHLLRGVRTSYFAVLEAGRPVDDIFLKNMTAQVCDHQLIQHMETGCEDPRFRYVQLSWRGAYNGLRSTIHDLCASLDDRLTKDLDAAIDLLHQVTERVCPQQSQNLLRMICAWPVNVPKSFVDLLGRGLPITLVVYAHWLVLMVLVEDLWWVHDMGRAGIRDVVAMCSDADQSLRSLLIYPQQMLDL